MSSTKPIFRSCATRFHASPDAGQTSKKARPRRAGRGAFYVAQGAYDAALEFLDAFRHALAEIEQYPGAGSPRYAEGLGIANLRHRKLARFPWLVFYEEFEDHTDVWRILHARRDVPESLQDPE